MQDRLKGEMKQAMRDRKKERLGVIRLIMAAIKQKQVDEQIVLDVGTMIIVSGCVKML